MADPVSGATSDTSGGGWLSDVGKFLSSPTGQLATAAGTAGLGLYQASQASKQAQGQAGQIAAAGAPAGALYSGTIGQLTGGPTVGGPTGQVISGTTGAATGLLQTAEQYASGALTPAQKMLIEQQTAGQTASLDASLGNRVHSSARTQGLEAIGNNAAMLEQQLVQQNVALAQGALQSATSAYTNLITTALQGGQLGLSATSTAVQTAIQSDQQISQYIQQLIAGIAQGLSGGTGGTGTTGLGTNVGGALQKLFQGGGGTVNPQTTAFNTAAEADVNQAIGQTQAQTAQSLSDMQPTWQITDPTVDTSGLASSVSDVGQGWG